MRAVLISFCRRMMTAQHHAFDEIALVPPLSTIQNFNIQANPSCHNPIGEPAKRYVAAVRRTGHGSYANGRVRGEDRYVDAAEHKSSRAAEAC